MSEPTTPETMTYHSLQVQHAENVKWKSKFHRWIRRFYIEVQLGDIVHKSERAGKLGTSSNPSANQYEWNETFPLLVHASNTHISIKLKHKSSYKSDPCIGYIEGELTELLSGKKSVSLRKGHSESSPVLATLFFDFKASDAKRNANAALCNLKSSLTEQNQYNCHFVQADAEQTLNQEVEEGPDDVDSDKFQAIRHVVPNINRIAMVMAEVSGIGSDLTHAWQLTRDLYSAILGRIKTPRVIELVGKLFATFEFVRTDARLSDILKNMDVYILHIFDAVSRCCLFIRHYARLNPFTRRIHRSVETDKIVEIENSLEEVKTELEDDFIIQRKVILGREPLAPAACLYSLDVEYKRDAPTQGNFSNQRTQFYVEARLSDVPERALSRLIQDTSEALTLRRAFSLISYNPSSLLIVKLIQEEPSPKKRSRIGIHRFKLDELLERCKPNQGGVRLDCSSGFMLLDLKEIDKITSASIEIKNTKQHVEKAGGGRLSKAVGFTAAMCGVITSQGDENSNSYASAGKLLLKLDAFAKIADDISALHPYLRVAWGLASTVYKVISHQIRTDASVVGLLSPLEAKFDFVRDSVSLRNKLFFLKSAVEKLLKTSEECCEFIERYFKRPFARRIVSLSDEEEIKRHENSLSQVTIMFDEGEKQYKEALEAHSRLKTQLEPSDMDAYSRPSCLEGTQVEVRRKIKDWFASDSGKPVLWLHGVAGSGKSTIANTIAQELKGTRRLGAYMFFERTKSKPEKVVRTMAYQLAKSNLVIAKHVEDCTVDNTVEHFPSFKDLIIGPLAAANSYVEGPIIIILDALDECGKPSERIELLRTLAASFKELPSKFRMLITSRPETDIQDVLLGHESVLDVKLDHALQASRDDVSDYFTHKMHELFKRPSIKKQVMSEPRLDSNIRRLASAANGLFIWASTAAKYISSRTDIAYKTLEKLVDDVQSENNHLEFGIDMLYTTILNSVDLAWDDSERKLQVSRVLYLVLTVNVHLSTDDIDAILVIPSGTASVILSRLQSVLTYKPDSRSRLRFLHASFSDFLTSDKHANERWFVDIHSNEEYINQRCLDSFDIMEQSLRFNICGAISSFKANTDKGQLRYSIDEGIPTSLRDACLSWARQLRIQPCTDVFLEKLSGFLYNRLLFWLEVLSLIEKVDEASAILLDVIRWIIGSAPSLESFLRDAQELSTTFSSAISRSLPHIYLSMLPLARKDSRVASHYSHFVNPTTKVVMAGHRRDASSRKRLRVDSRYCSSVSYSPDGRHIAAGSSKNTVTIWDPESGEVFAGPMKGHTGFVNSVAFSPDGERIVSGSADKTVRVWDIERAEGILVIEGHMDDVNSVAFSRDGKFIVSGSYDHTVRVWDAKSGKPVLGPMEGHESAVKSVSFSPDGKYIASGSADKTVRIWDVLSGKVVKDSFKGHTYAVCSIAYSPDGKYIVSGSGDQTIIVWDAESGQIVAGPLKGHKACIESVAYSPNGKYIVSGSQDYTSRVWAVNGSEVVPYAVKGHCDVVSSVGFSADSQRVVSCTIGCLFAGVIDIWDIERGNGESNSFNGHISTITSVAFLPDNRRVVSGSWDGTIGVWDTKSGKLVLGPLKGHTDCVNCVACSLDGKFILSGSDDGTVRVWNAETGELVRTLTGVGSSVFCVAVSRDGKRVVAGSSSRICIWDMETGDLVLALKGHTKTVRAVCFSPDGSLIASGSHDKTLIVWNAKSGTIVAGPFEGHAGWITAVVFSPDGKRILSGSRDNTIRVWNTKTGQLVIAPFKGQAIVNSISISPDGRHVASGSRDSTITVWNAENGDIVQGPLRGHTRDVNCVAYSSDGKYILSGSDDGTIKVWDAENEIAPSALSEGNAQPNWTLSQDGWILGQGGQLLLWLPRDMCTALWQPRNTAVLNSRFIARLRFREHGIGESWEECIDQKAFAE